MNWQGIQRLIGMLLMLFSVTVLPPLAVSLLTADGEAGHFALTFLVTLGTGLGLWLPVHRDRSELKVRQAFLVVALYWSVLGVFGALPFIFGPHLDFTDAVFESVSGFTTTGATVLTGLDEMPPSILYHRQQLQWIGGMGVVVLAVAIIPMLGVGGMQLYRAEIPGPMKEDKLSPRVMNAARTLWYLYLGLTVACTLAFWAAGMTLFDAVCHAFATIATGGFSTHDASIAFFDSTAVEMVANVFMLLGAINFSIHFVAWRGRKPLTYWRDAETRAFLLLVLAASLAVAVTLWLTATYPTFWSSLRAGAFQVISVITTTGFATAPFADWPLYLPLLISVLAFIGGAAGSTAGGLKVIRVMLLLKQSLREVFRLVHPRSVQTIKLGNRPVGESVMEAVWGFCTLYLVCSIVLTGLMMAAGLDLVTAYGAVMATINLVGPGLGDVATTFAGTPDTVKWLGIFAMLLGRLEVFTLFVLFTPAFWRN